MKWFKNGEINAKCQAPLFNRYIILLDWSIELEEIGKTVYETTGLVRRIVKNRKKCIEPPD